MTKEYSTGQDVTKEVGELVGGEDGNHLFYPLLTDNAGRLYVNVNGTLTVGGTITNTPAADVAYGTVGGAKVTATGSAVVLATNTARLVRIKASVSNSTSIYLGPTGVTTGGTNAWTELAGGDDTGWLPITNTNLIYAIAASGSPVFYYWFLV